MPTYKFTYFDGKGRGEIIRLILVAGGIPFEDIRVTQADWPTMKPNTPYGSLPILSVDGQVLGQSIALARMAGKIAGLNGTTNIDQAKLDAYVDVIIETREEFGKYMFMKDSPEKEKGMKTYFEEFVPAKLKLLESKATANGHFVGNKISWADIALYSITEWFPQVDIVKDFPKLKKITDKVKQDSKIKAYLAKRKPTPF